MGDLSSTTILLLMTFFISHSCFLQAVGNTSVTKINREALEIIIGGGVSPPTSPPAYGNCPPPPPPEPECPPPPPPPIPPPPPPPPPPPSPPRRPRSPPSFPRNPFFLNANLQMAIRAIQRFKARITDDPQNVTDTWKGKKICIDPSKYKGFICDSIPGDKTLRVAGVKFNGYHFYGPRLNLTRFIEELKDLVFFHANSNNITGPISSKISELPYFYELDLSNNKLSGPFPEAVLGAKNLTFLDLRFNYLTGTVPPQVFNLDLDVLFLNNNKFVGKLPENLGSTPVLYLTLANNKFIGSIPRSIGQASNTLVEVLFLNNQLSGCLPYEIGFLKKATVFDASSNLLTGPMPHSFGCLAKMEQLNLSYNKFFGPVPEMVCKLHNLYKLSLNHNYFTQVGPECRKLIKRKVLDVSMNCILDLPSQRSPAECAAFFSKHISCPNERSYKLIPCDIAHSVTQETSHRTSTPTIAPSPSYSALIKHRL